MASPGRSLPAPSAAVYGVVCAGLLLAAAALRFYGLSERPLHGDEGVNSWFVGHVLEGKYRYDASNYHGPSLFYFQAFFLRACEEIGALSHAGGWLRSSVTVLRSGVAATGVLVVACMLLWVRYLGRWGVVGALFLAGVSCTHVYFSRDFIHETPMVLFTSLFALGTLEIQRRRTPGALAFTLTAGALALCTKETWVLNLGAILFAHLTAELALHLREEARFTQALALVAGSLGRTFAVVRPFLWLAALPGLAIWLFLYSSAFSHPRGWLDSLEAFAPWAHQAVDSGHVKPTGYYLSTLLARYEVTTVLLWLAGSVLALAAHRRPALFLTHWSIWSLLFYSLIPYKTPWLVLNALLPMILVAARGFQELLDRGRARRPAAVAVAALGIALSVPIAHDLTRTLRVNFLEFDAPEHPQTYVQTHRDVFRLLDAVSAWADGEEIGIDVYFTDYWPLPFYLEAYGKARFWGRPHPPPAPPRARTLILARQDQRRAMSARRYRGYFRSGTYLLRSGFPLDLYLPRAGRGP